MWKEEFIIIKLKNKEKLFEIENYCLTSNILWYSNDIQIYSNISQFERL